MDKVVEARLFRVWLVLVGITLLSWWLGQEQVGADARAHTAVAYAALAIVAVKVRVIVAAYMDARHWSKKLQLGMDVWLVLLLGALATIYTLKLGMPTV